MVLLSSVSDEEKLASFDIASRASARCGRRFHQGVGIAIQVLEHRLDAVRSLARWLSELDAAIVQQAERAAAVGGMHHQRRVLADVLGKPGGEHELESLV